jgi:hypothetical protein
VQTSIDQQRKKYLDEFYAELLRCNFEQLHQQYHYRSRHSSTIERRHLCEHHLTDCNLVDRSLEDLFKKWDDILALFPSHAALEEYDSRYNSKTREGRIFYEKLSVFQAWYNLNAEINHLINVLGSIMACNECQAWPKLVSSSSSLTSRLKDHLSVNASRPQTPSSTSSVDFKETSTSSPSNTSSYLFGQNMLKQQLSSMSTSSSSFSTAPDGNMRRHRQMSSMTSLDNPQANLTVTSPLTEFYYR